MVVGLYITRDYCRQRRQYLRSDLETAWLVVAEEQDTTASGGAASVSAVQRLQTEFGWDRAKAMELVIVARRWNGED